ncbi:unnamed protein product [Timema podura]|uniref:Uncharacterized protein n=1 Tax=Timema podura TaxID=61482 RepID=A0ABN7NMG3_TIMPD|nr:unnamed protein product [Timema podura]
MSRHLFERPMYRVWSDVIHPDSMALVRPPGRILCVGSVFLDSVHICTVYPIEEDTKASPILGPV